MSFDEAWERFFSLPQRKRRPADPEKRIARDVCEDCDARLFRIRKDEEIIYSEDHVVHINPTFMSTKCAASHVFVSDKYPGYSHRYEFTSFVEPSPPQPSTVVGKVLCPEFRLWVNPGVECGFCGGVHVPEGQEPQRD
jgi:hypothetical protein